MMPTTPSGTRILPICRPFSRVRNSSISPTGSGRAAIWRKPSHMASMVFSLSRRRSSRASFKPFCAACSISWALAARMAV